ncbi:hypothetical protein [Pararcticibacter amylolyticus]|uniref:Uncharacterized protein n=1 Tax=Pararcticibacter amylolyticus TaxID=2173175 RepID=A0A2U2PCS8_9SPHI|nr:hypothetical protein [Pararcticibacter amylolyticus]PWG79160.1 hypothetical protein DDR33_19135 [Pararcticibacter amylolyticus]
MNPFEKDKEENKKSTEDLSQAEKDTLAAEEFIISNSNGNGINPNPIESGNASDWETGTMQNEHYKEDASSPEE